MVTGRGPLRQTHEEKTAISLLEPLIERHLDDSRNLCLATGQRPSCGLCYSKTTDALDRVEAIAAAASVLALVREEDMMHDDNGASYRDPFGLGAQWHFRTLTHFVTALQPLAQDILGEPPLQYQTAWHALLKVVFHNLDRLMSACLTPRDQWVGAVKEEEYDATCGRDALRNSYEPESDQRLMNELKRFEASALWRANVAHEMGGPLNAILNHAEALLEIGRPCKQLSRAS